MRQIVAGLTGDSDGTGDLAVELSKTDPASLETGQDSEDDSGEPEDWVPDPVDADPGQRLPALLPGSGFRGVVQSGRRCGLQFVAMWALELEGIHGQSVTPPGSPGFFTWLGWRPRPDPWGGGVVPCLPHLLLLLQLEKEWVFGLPTSWARPGRSRLVPSVPPPCLRGAGGARAVQGSPALSGAPQTSSACWSASTAARTSSSTSTARCWPTACCTSSASAPSGEACEGPLRVPREAWPSLAVAALR